MLSLSLSQNNVLNLSKAKTTLTMAFLWICTSFSVSAQCDAAADFTFSISNCNVTMTPVSGTPPLVISYAWNVTNSSTAQVFKSGAGGPISNSGTPINLNQAGFTTLNHAIVLLNGTLVQCTKTVFVPAISGTFNITSITQQTGTNTANISYTFSFTNPFNVASQPVQLNPVLPPNVTLNAPVADFTVNNNQSKTVTFSVTTPRSLNCYSYPIDIKPLAGCAILNGVTPTTIGYNGTIVQGNLSNYYDFNNHQWNFSNNNIVCGGDVIADIDDNTSSEPNMTNFDNFNIFMRPNSQMIIAPNSGLRLLTTSVIGCGDMWQGINAEDPAPDNKSGLIVTDANSRIEDAENAIHFKNRNTFFENTTFAHNWIAIYADNGYSPAIISNCTVTGGILADKREGFCGVYAVGIPHLEYGFGEINSFSKLHYGLFAIGCDEVVSNVDVFNDMNFSDDNSIGILYANGSLTYTAPAITKGAFHFDKCETGIHGSNSVSSNIRGAIMSGISQGINIYGSSKNNIKDNTIDCNKEGIYIHATGLYPISNGYNLIDNNTIKTFGNGIVVESVERGGCFVKNNNVSLEQPLKNFEFGIRISDYYSRLCNNAISLNGSRHNGIQIESGISRLSKNSCKGSDANWGYNGISILMASNDMDCNDVAKTIQGISFYGACLSDNRFVQNTFNDHYYGLYLDKSGEIGEQGRLLANEKYTQNGNTWSGKYILNGAFHEGSLQQAYKSRFYVDKKSNPAYMPPSVNIKDWFKSITAIYIKECNADCNYIESKVPTKSTNYHDDIALRDIPTDEDVRIQVKDRLMKRWLYNSIKNDEFTELSNVLQKFASNEANNNIGKWNTLEKDLVALNSTSYSNELEALEKENNDAINEYKEIVKKVQSEIVNDGNVSKETLLLLSEKRTTISTIVNKIKATKTLAKNETIEKATIVKENNSSIITNTTDEYNERTVNDIYLDLLSNDTQAFSSEQESALYHIAYQCPLEGGKAVYTARVMLRNNKYNIDDISDEEICGFSTPKTGTFIQTKQAKIVEDFKVFPNPTNDIINIMLPTAYTDEQGYDFIMFDNMGKLVERKTIYPMTINKIPTINFANGIYFYTIQSTSGEYINHSKIVVQK